MKTFVVAIPLFDKDMAVQAYRLCDRNADKLFGTANDYQAAGEYLLSPGLRLVDRIGLEPFTGNMPLMVELNQYLLMMGVPTNIRIAPEKVICLLPSDLEPDAYILEKCKGLLEMGYSIGINGFPLNAPRSPLLEMASHVLLDYTGKDYLIAIKAMIPHMLTKHVVIGNVPDMPAFSQISSTPGALFSGSFYNQPVTINAEGISPLKVNALQLLNQVTHEDFDLADIAKVVERDPSISITLLRYINSPAVGMKQRISSIRSAVAILGQKELKRWVNVAVSVRLAEDRPSEITKLSLVRAKFAENLASAYELGVFAPSLFMAGLFSLLDVILEKPMPEAIGEVAVDERVRMALVERTGPLYEVLDMIYAYERANWDRVSINMIRNGIDANTLSDAFIDALVWYKQLLSDIDNADEDEAQDVEDVKATPAAEEPADTLSAGK